MRSLARSFLAYGGRLPWGKALGLSFALLAAPLAAQNITIAALGDSLTAGYGLPQGDGFVPQLQDWLTARGHDVAVLNAGVSGDTSAGGAARVDWTLTPDVDAMIVALGGNDLLRGIPPEVTRANLTAILEAATARNVPVVLAGLPAPLNFGPEYKAEFDAIYPDLADAYGALLYPNFIAGVEASMATSPSPPEYIQPDGLHPSASGVAAMVNDIGPVIQELIARIP